MTPDDSHDYTAFAISDHRGYVRPDDDPPFSADPRPLSANAIHAAMAEDPLMPPCGGTHAMGYATCQRIAAMNDRLLDAERASHAALDVERLALAMRSACPWHANRTDVPCAAAIAREYAALDGEPRDVEQLAQDDADEAAWEGK